MNENADPKDSIIRKRLERRTEQEIQKQTEPDLDIEIKYPIEDILEFEAEDAIVSGVLKSMPQKGASK